MKNRSYKRVSERSSKYVTRVEKNDAERNKIIYTHTHTHTHTHIVQYFKLH